MKEVIVSSFVKGSLVRLGFDYCNRSYSYGTRYGTRYLRVPYRTVLYAYR
jgi:hypothetical protein